MNKLVRIVVVNPDNISRMGIRTLLSDQADLTLVGETSDYQEINQISQKLSPNVLLLSASLSSARIVKIVDELHYQNPYLHVLILTPTYDEADLNALLTVGVHGYIVTTDPAESLIQAIRTAVLGGTWFSPCVIKRMIAMKVQTLARRATVEPLAQLTMREVQVLESMTDGWTNQQIGHTLGLTERTVRFHLRNIYDKLDFKTRGEAISWAIRNGMARKLSPLMTNKSV